MAVQQFNPAPRPAAHPMANPGYGKRLAPPNAPAARTTSHICPGVKRRSRTMSTGSPRARTSR